MDALIAGLKGLGAEVDLEAYGGLTVNDVRFSVEVTKKGDKSIYEIGYGNKLSSVKDAAYYILSEYVPRAKRLLSLSTMIQKVASKLPSDMRLRMMMDGEVRLVGVKDGAHFRELVGTLESLLTAPE